MNYFLSFFGILKVFLASLLFVYLVCRIYRNDPPKGMIFICIYFSLYFYIEYCDEVTKAFSTSPNSHTFEAVIEDIRWPVKIVLVEIDGEKFCRVTVSPKGPVAGLWIITTLRSGLPEYVFNTQGVLVDSTPDHQDDSNYQSKWGKAIKFGQITREEFIAITRESKIGRTTLSE